MARTRPTWLAEFQRLLALESYTSHIDELLGQAYDGPHAVKQSLRLYEELIRSVRKRNGAWVAVLVIPLHFANGERWSDEMDMRVPELTNWQSEWAAEEPPTIGIYRRRLLLCPDSVEEYRRPITENVLPVLNGKVECYYRVWRSISEVDAPEEYTRAVYLEYYGN